MMVRQRRSAALMFAVAGLALAGCTKIQDRQGYVADETLIASVQPGVDNRDSVTTTLGRPTFVGQFDANDWYYVSRVTKNLAFNLPRPHSQSVVRIRFDEAGNVVAVDKRGMEQVASIDPSGDKTPTLGSERSLLEELFGNIGAVGTGNRPSSTSDNPQ